MCIIVWSQDIHPFFKFVMVANRDEYYDRETSPLCFWQDHGNILAGKDMKGGGTWLGVTKDGKFAALTNFRVPFHHLRETAVDAKKDGVLSRGHLLVDYLKGNKAPYEYLQEKAKAAQSYNDFNLLVGDLGREPSEICYLGTRTDNIAPMTLERKRIYGVTNAVLDTPWWKLERAKKNYKKSLDHSIELMSKHKEAIEQDKELRNTHTLSFVDDLFLAFSDNQLAEEVDLPDTGVPKEWEHKLSSIFVSVEHQRYGTRSQAVLLVDYHNRLTFVERTRKVSSLVDVPKSANLEVVQTEEGSWMQTIAQFTIHNQSSSSSASSNLK